MNNSNYGGVEMYCSLRVNSLQLVTCSKMTLEMKNSKVSLQLFFSLGRKMYSYWDDRRFDRKWIKCLQRFFPTIVLASVGKLKICSLMKDHISKEWSQIWFWLIIFRNDKRTCAVSDMSQDHPPTECFQQASCSLYFVIIMNLISALLKKQRRQKWMNHTLWKSDIAICSNHDTND